MIQTDKSHTIGQQVNYRNNVIDRSALAAKMLSELLRLGEILDLDTGFSLNYHRT